MIGHGYHSNLPAKFSAKTPVATALVAHLGKAVRLQDSDEFPKGAFQAGQETGNPTVESLSRFLPEMVLTKKRKAQRRRTKKGARRPSSCERAGSLSAH